MFGANYQSIRPLLLWAALFSTALGRFESRAQSAADPALAVPLVNTAPLPQYGYDRLRYAMTIGVERTPKGRLWACWVGGGDSADGFFVLATSDNNGKTWSDPRVVIDPHDTRLEQKRRALVGALWTDPRGRLWLFFDQAMTYFDGRAGDWYTICENPDSDNPVWSTPERIGYGCTLNKPTVLADGTWLLPVSLWDRGKIHSPFKEAFGELDSLRMANVFASSDGGKSWTRRGGVRFPQPQFDEHHVVERGDGTLWMTARTGNGIWESTSVDGGLTWSEPRKSAIAHLGSRHFIRRLQSGRLLLVKHGIRIDERTEKRSHLTAFLSDDDGKTWQGGLLLDERIGISYPDGFQAPNGVIYISYDRNRSTDAEILMARFKEKDVLSGRFRTAKAKAKMLISKPEGLQKTASQTAP